MHSHVKRIQIPATWTRGTRKRTRAIPRRYQNEDLYVFREMSKLSRRAAGRYIDRLLGPR
jgi:hypothetical protein